MVFEVGCRIVGLNYFSEKKVLVAPSVPMSLPEWPSIQGVGYPAEEQTMGIERVKVNKNYSWAMCFTSLYISSRGESIYC